MTEPVDPIVAYRVRVEHLIEPDGSPRYTVRWGAGEDDTDFMTALGLLRLAEDVILNAAFGRDRTA